MAVAMWLQSLYPRCVLVGRYTGKEKGVIRDIPFEPVGMKTRECVGVW